MQHILMICVSKYTKHDTNIFGKVKMFCYTIGYLSTWLYGMKISLIILTKFHWSRCKQMPCSDQITFIPSWAEIRAA